MLVQASWQNLWNVCVCSKKTQHLKVEVQLYCMDDVLNFPLMEEIWLFTNHPRSKLPKAKVDLWCCDWSICHCIRSSINMLLCDSTRPFTLLCCLAKLLMILPACAFEIPDCLVFGTDQSLRSTCSLRAIRKKSLCQLHKKNRSQNIESGFHQGWLCKKNSWIMCKLKKVQHVYCLLLTLKL